MGLLRRLEMEKIQRLKLRAIRLGLGLAVCQALWFACGVEQQPASDFVISGRTMGTSFTVKVADKALPPASGRLKLEADIDKLLKEVNRQMSTYLADSEISKFNHSRDIGWQPVSPDFAAVTKRALALAVQTDGALDVTVGPLVNLWGFGPERTRDTLPDEKTIQAMKALAGYRNLEAKLEHAALRKKIPELYCDLSSIAKGFGVDKVAQFLEHQGIQNYMVEIGGEVRTRGHNPQGGLWRIGVETPDAPTGIKKVITISNRAMATSGDYFNYFEVAGVRYSHTIDPRTGWPVKHDLASVTVIHDSCMVADGLATAINVMGPETGFEFAVEQGLAVYFLVRQDDGFLEKMTPAFESYLASKN